MSNKKAQVTLWVILAIAIVVLAIGTFFVLNKNIITPKQNEVESYFLTCANEKVKEAVALAELQGGYLSLPDFEKGSELFPFSNYFKFVTLDIPYWFYVSGNSLQKVQKPSLEEIEKQFEKNIKLSIQDCLDFTSFKDIYVNFTSPRNVSVNIKPTSIETTISLPLTVLSSDYEYRNSEHKITTKTSFGSLYNSASRIFDAEKQTNILENYSLDVINAYAPTTGLEISCVPKIWYKDQVKQQIKEALEANIQELKVSGGNFKLKKPENKYFIIKLDNNKQVNFLYQRNWPTYIEVWPSTNNLLESDPIGQEAGLGSLGFCFIPYHFVYDLSFPVLIQISSDTEIFQFPVIVTIEKMMPKKFEFNETIPQTFDLCQDAGQIGTVFTSSNSIPIESDISFRCLMQTCDIGKTNKTSNQAELTTKFPRCVNGKIIASAVGYKTSEVLVSTNDPFILSIFLSKQYTLPIQINSETNERVVISFNSEDSSQIIFYPEQTSLNLSEGLYNISVQIYKDSILNLGSQQVEKCIKVPSPGLPGMLGLKDTQCYNLTLPASQVTSVPIGGGKLQKYFSDSELKNARKIKINTEKFSTPTNLDDLSDIYLSINLNTLQITLE